MSVVVGLASPRLERLLAWAAMLFIVSWSFRAAAVGLAKLLLITAALVFLCVWIKRSRPMSLLPEEAKRVAQVSVTCLLALAASAWWTPVDAETAAGAWVKQSKLLLPVLMVLALPTVSDVKRAWMVLFAVQSLVIALTWWIECMGRPQWLGPDGLGPHFLRRQGITEAPTPFTTYIDQSLMHAVAAACAWYLRTAAARFHVHAKPVLVMFAVASLATCFYLPGRSGHLVALALMGWMLWIALPWRLRILAVTVPPLVLAAVLAASPRQMDRTQKMFREVTEFKQQREVNTSIGERLHYWSVASELISAKPLLGHGLGSWHHAYLAQTSGRVIPLNAKTVRNPHQEYLMWGVQLGVVGVALLLAWMAVIVRQAHGTSSEAKNATTAVALALAVTCLINCSIWDALIGDFFCGMLGLCLATAVAMRRQDDAR